MNPPSGEQVHHKHINVQKPELGGRENASEAQDEEPEDKGSLQRFLTSGKSFSLNISVSWYVKMGIINSPPPCLSMLQEMRDKMAAERIYTMIWIVHIHHYFPKG